MSLFDLIAAGSIPPPPDEEIIAAGKAIDAELAAVSDFRRGTLADIARRSEDAARPAYDAAETVRRDIRRHIDAGIDAAHKDRQQLLQSLAMPVYMDHDETVARLNVLGVPLPRPGTPLLHQATGEAMPYVPPASVNTGGSEVSSRTNVGTSRTSSDGRGTNNAGLVKATEYIEQQRASRLGRSGGTNGNAGQPDASPYVPQFPDNRFAGSGQHRPDNGVGRGNTLSPSLTAAPPMPGGGVQMSIPCITVDTQQSRTDQVWNLWVNPVTCKWHVVIGKPGDGYYDGYEWLGCYDDQARAIQDGDAFAAVCTPTDGIPTMPGGNGDDTLPGDDGSDRIPRDGTDKPKDICPGSTVHLSCPACGSPVIHNIINVPDGTKLPDGTTPTKVDNPVGIEQPMAFRWQQRSQPWFRDAYNWADQDFKDFTNSQTYADYRRGVFTRLADSLTPELPL